MNREEILKTLQTLHSELAAVDNLDDQTRQQLQAVTDDIQRVLTGAEPAVGGQGDGGGEGDQSLSQRLKELVIDFEVRHPIIGGLLERVTDGLAGMGI